MTENKKKKSMQNEFLANAKASKKVFTFYLINGVPIKGKVKDFDNFTIKVEKDGKLLMIYKHAISTISEE